MQPTTEPKGTIALTGYDGILGYRTDSAYKTRENLSDDQVKWLEEHPDFDWEKECEEAKKVAEAIKADGWTFASHTWGHIRIGDASLEHIQTDTERWLQDVAPLIGGNRILSSSPMDRTLRTGMIIRLTTRNLTI